MTTILEGAREILRRNDRGGRTVPSSRLYPHQWAWDSAFIAIGWAEFDVERALRELETLFEGQWEDGRIPHIQFRQSSHDYFPGPAMWGREQSSTITNPPIWSIALRRIFQSGASPERVRALLPRVDASLEFFSRDRDPLGWGLVATVHPWESGMDNSPAWDGPMRAVDATRAPPFERVDNKVVTDSAQRPSDEEYQRFIVLVRDIADDDFGPGSFSVYDPCFSALRLWAERDLAELAAELGFECDAARRAQRAQEGLERLWRPEHGRFVYHDVVAGVDIAEDVIGAYIPALFEQRGQRADECLSHFKERYGGMVLFPSTAPSNPHYDPCCYWRGPSWVNLAWLFAQRDEFRGQVEQQLAQVIESCGFREYYHPESGKGLGAERFSWTAALALDLLGGH